MSLSVSKKTILVVEDEDILVQAITKKLSVMGFEYIVASTCDQVKEIISDTTKIPDAVWLDYYLGRTNGVEVMTCIKNKDGWCNVPVVVVSNSATDAKINEMLNLGASKYLLKAQHRLDEIINTFNEIISVQQS